MTTERKPRQKRTPTATQTADRIDREIRDFIEIRAIAQKRITEAMAECPLVERAQAVRVLNVLRDDMCGFSLEVGNDAQPAPADPTIIDPATPDDFPETYGGTGVPAHNLGPDGPVTPTERVERDEAGARRVGKART